MKIGDKAFVRTVTDFWVGVVTAIPGPYTVTLEQASWVADTGRLSVFMREGRAPNMEIEPVGDVTCQWLSWMPWPHKLFTEAV